jgi:hypothetical protein
MSTPERSYTPSSGSRMGPVASISVRLRILATLRRWRPAIIRSTPAPAQRLAKERAAASKGGCASWKSLRIPWPVAGRLTVSQQGHARSSKFPAHKRRPKTTTGIRQDLADLAMCAALSISSRISFDRKEVEKRPAPVAQSLRWLSVRSWS